LLLSLMLAGGQIDPASTAPAPASVVTGAFFPLSVSDLQASAEWYERMFGLKVVLNEPGTGGPGVVVLEGGGLIVELIRHPDAKALERIAPGATDHMLVHGIVKAGFRVDDFDKTVAALRAKGVEIAFGPYPARGNQHANVILKDNAGNLIQLFGR